MVYSFAGTLLNKPPSHEFHPHDWNTSGLYSLSCSQFTSVLRMVPWWPGTTTTGAHGPLMNSKIYSFFVNFSGFWPLMQ